MTVCNVLFSLRLSLNYGFYTDFLSFTLRHALQEISRTYSNQAFQRSALEHLQYECRHHLRESAKTNHCKHYPLYTQTKVLNKLYIL